MKSPSERFVILVFLLLEAIQLVQAAPPTFITPDPNGGTSPRSVDENAPKDQSILTVEGQDTDGDILSFSIVSQIPISPPFELNTTSGEFKTPAGLNYETHTSYTFRFGVSDGSPTVNSVDFVVNINNLNDEVPVFSPTSYTQSISLGSTAGTSVLTVSATDADVSPAFNTITYSITGGDTNSLFVIGSSTGQINTTSNPLVVGAYALTIQASDTTNTATATANINVGASQTTSSDGSTNYAWTAGVAIGVVLVIIIIVAFLRYLRIISCHKVPFCGVPIENWISRTSNRPGSDTSDEDAMKPMTETSTSPKVEKADPTIELESQAPNTDKEENRSDKPVNNSSEKYIVNTDEKPSLHVMSETNKTENGDLKDTSNNAEAKSNDSNFDTKEDISSTSM